MSEISTRLLVHTFNVYVCAYGSPAMFCTTFILLNELHMSKSDGVDLQLQQCRNQVFLCYSVGDTCTSLSLQYPGSYKCGINVHVVTDAQ